VPVAARIAQRLAYYKKLLPVRPERLIRAEPAPQNALNAVPDLWASRFPPPFEELQAGTAPLFTDERMTWAFSALGGIEGMRVLELGPLEGGHSYMAQQAGAASLTAVEMNSLAFLKCLVTKELLGLDRCNFLAGDATAFMESSNETFDLCIACGILYHMVDPIRMIDLVSKRAQRVVIWTHFYDHDAVAANRRLGARLGPARQLSYGGFDYHVHQHKYGLDTRIAGFCGGTEAHSNWLPRADILRALGHFGWENTQIAFEEVNNPNGPCFALVASKPNTAR
jgi:hypothetical protein